MFDRDQIIKAGVESADEAVGSIAAEFGLTDQENKEAGVLFLKHLQDGTALVLVELGCRKEPERAKAIASAVFGYGRRVVVAGITELNRQIAAAKAANKEPHGK